MTFLGVQTSVEALFTQQGQMKKTFDQILAQS